MPRIVTIQERIERRTYIKGLFKGKFIGFLDYQKSDILHENFYNLEVLSGEIQTSLSNDNLRHWETGEPEEFQPVEKFLTKLPTSLPLEIKSSDGKIKRYIINLNQPKLTNYILSKQVYDLDKVLGDIEGLISGYILHYDSQDIDVEVEDDEDENINKSNLNIGSSFYKTNKATGKTEVLKNYKRFEYFNSDGSKYWGDWIKQGSTKKFSLGNAFSWLLQILFCLFILIPFIILGWKIILPILIVCGLIYLISIFRKVFERIWLGLVYLLGFAMIIFAFLGLKDLFTQVKRDIKLEASKHELKEEIQSVSTDPLTGDSVISHYRVWNDYQGEKYDGYIKVKLSDLNSSSNFRNNINIAVNNQKQYNSIVSEINSFDQNRLNLLYIMFDSLKAKYQPDEFQFAEIITSCIQDIPYTLILQDDCDATLYNDEFISNYLSNGGSCVGSVKFGLYSPIEFIGTLNGDCDTRTLLLYTVLDHYKYDVAMLSSDVYRHSLLGINLPYKGVSKFVNGKRYVLWESTQLGAPPGVISKEISDIRFWNVSLISQSNSLL